MTTFSISELGRKNDTKIFYLILDGLGSRFNGRYFVMGTTHTIGDGGYTTQFECRREEPKGGSSG